MARLWLRSAILKTLVPFHPQIMASPYANFKFYLFCSKCCHPLCNREICSKKKNWHSLFMKCGISHLWNMVFLSLFCVSCEEISWCFLLFPVERNVAQTSDHSKKIKTRNQNKTNNQSLGKRNFAIDVFNKTWWKYDRIASEEWN